MGLLGRNGAGDDPTDVIVWIFLAALQGAHVRQWIERLGDDDVAVRDEATARLVGAGDLAVRRLNRALRSSDPEISGRASDLLLRMATGAAAPPIQLKIDPVEPGAESFLLHVTNPTGRPVFLTTSRLCVAGLRIASPLEPRYFRLGPGERVAIPLSGKPSLPAAKLWPYYRGPEHDSPSKEAGLHFHFKGLRVDELLQYVSQETGWIFVMEKRCSGTVDAEWSQDVPRSKLIEYLNARIRTKAVVLLNPYSPGLPAPGQVLKLVEGKPLHR